MFRFLRSVTACEWLALLNFSLALLLAAAGECGVAVLNLVGGFLLLNADRITATPPAPVEDWRTTDTEFQAWMDAREREFLDNPTPANPFEPGSRDWLELEFDNAAARNRPDAA